MSLIVMYVYPAPPTTLVPIVATTKGNFPTRASLVSDPESRISALRLPSPGSYFMPSHPAALYSLLPTPPPRFPKYASIPPLETTKRPYCNPPLVALLASAHFEYRLQRYSLCYGCLLSPYVGNPQLHSHRFPHCFHPGPLTCPIWKLLRLLTCDPPKKTCVSPLYLPLHFRQKYLSLSSKE